MSEFCAPVHNHGTEDGPGLACREIRVNGRLVGACMFAESPTHPDAPHADEARDDECGLLHPNGVFCDKPRGHVGSHAAYSDSPELCLSWGTLSVDAPRAGGETPEMRIDALLHDFQQACEEAAGFAEFSSQPAKDAAMLRAILRNELRSALLARHRDGERAEWHRRMSDEHCGTDEIVGYGPYHAEMLSDEALFLELGEEIFTVYFDKKKPCLNDGRAHRKGVLQMRYEETRARSAPPSPERASK